MKGSVQVKVWNNRVQYKFTIRRNITILKGNSATGKTTLINMIEDFQNDKQSGIYLQCEKECLVVSGRYWKDQLKHIKDSIVFIDEGNAFLTSKEFAEAIKKTDNYYVIATRNPLSELPYSVDEVYGITNRTRGYGQIRRLYSEFKRLYTQETELNKVDCVIVEDSNSGYQFFKKYCNELGIPCISAKGKSNIVKAVINADINDNVLIIADGAAFGPEMDTLMQMRYSRHITLFLPESFEWIILSAGLLKDSDISLILEEPQNYIESSLYFSWERFFTAVLTDRSKDSYLSYNKRKLNPVYLQEHEKNQIIRVTPFVTMKESE